MTFMVVERFRHGPGPVRKRFAELGRMMPDGVQFVASWIVPGGDVCYQIMEAPHAALLDTWVEAWSDLVDFEVASVEESSEFWRDFDAASLPPKGE
ncbi:MAG TPA: DUF3303 family protein [Fimbriimonadaceae bacterium]|nr:DUF3303 family protein [Fimbriimonadaceae bacterium]